MPLDDRAAPAWTVVFPADDPALEAVPFGGAGEVEFGPASIALEQGQPLTGVRFTDPFPTTDYEIEVVAARRAGNDFFCALTFPIGDEHATLVLGGWGGSLVGLSCLDGLDASSNETKSFHRFERDVDYRLTLRVTAERLIATVAEADGPATTIVDLARTGRRFSLRPEVALSAPLGIASYSTRASIRRIAWRSIRRIAWRPVR